MTRAEIPADSIESPAVARAVTYAVDAGNRVADVTAGWAEARQVVTMAGALTPALRQTIERTLPGLRYWYDGGAPQFPATEGYFDDALGVGLAFPAKPETRW